MPQDGQQPTDFLPLEKTEVLEVCYGVSERRACGVAGPGFNEFTY